MLIFLLLLKCLLLRLVTTFPFHKANEAILAIKRGLLEYWICNK